MSCNSKFYILNMFPYPSGEGLHVGHPLGYVASDIFARYKKMKGYNVINPMGFDSFGLPAEQYAILTGQHPAVTTEKNVKHYIEQLKNIDLEFDWQRKFNTSDPEYYKWTQWIFIQMFNSFFCKLDNKAHNINDLYKYFSEHGTEKLEQYVFCKSIRYEFTADEWNIFSEDKKYKISLDYRIAYLDDIDVNWCEGLKTVLANDEVKNGVSERGGFPVIKKKMKQWALRITAYADRLLEGLNTIDWPESTKETQINWIGKSDGANINFKLDGLDYSITIFTSRPETIFGVTFIALSKDHDFVRRYCDDLNLKDLDISIEDKVGIQTKYYAINPINNEKIPIWLANYILSDYGTGAIMAVPELDERDKDFAGKYNITVKHILCDDKFINSECLNGLTVEEARKEILNKIKKQNIGSAVTTYRLRDAIFSRQRYWGEPIPIYYKDVIIDGYVEKLPFAVDENDLPLKLPEIEDFTPTGEAPLKRAKDWKYKGYELEINTMPGWAGSSWYFLRYLDPRNDKEFCSKEKLEEFENVDLYLGGSEHAVGHLLYSRFYTKFLYDLGYINFEEPFKKLIHQGMILGESAIIYRINETNKYITYLNHTEVKYHYKNNENKDIEITDKRSIKDEYLKLMKEKGVTPIHIPISFIDNEDYPENEYDEITNHLDELRNWRQDFNDAEFLVGEGYIVDQDGREYSPYAFFKVERTIEKMSKSKYNVINPDDIIDKYGSDVFRMYLMFLGPIEQQKPWNTKGIEGVARFLNRVNNLSNKIVDKKPDKNELKIVHKSIKDVEKDIENYSFNTAISAMMICLNGLSELKDISKEGFKNYLLLLKPFAPKTVINLWVQFFNNEDLGKMQFPEYNEEYIKEDTVQYAVMINGKTRTQVLIDKAATDENIKKIVLNNDTVMKYVKDQNIKNFIVVKNKVVSIVF